MDYDYYDDSDGEYQTIFNDGVYYDDDSDSDGVEYRNLGFNLSN